MQMVSPLWKACSEGDLQKVNDLLNDASTLDIELKDHTGVTPLIEAVRNGHVDVVRTLLDKGADPNNASSFGRPDQYTSDQILLDLLIQAQTRGDPSGKSSQNDPSSYPHSNPEADKAYYGSPPHPGAYPYYANVNPALSTVAEGGVYYPPPPLHPAGENHAPNGVGNLPPPEIARQIPCRYFPACRYGSSCMFAHPPTPYFQGPPPPTHYPPYEAMPSPYATNYYTVNPPSFQPPNGIHPMTPVSPPPAPPMAHGRSPSEVVSSGQGHYTPNGVHSMPVPMSVPSLPALHHQPTLPPPGPHSPSTMYSSNPSPATPFPGQETAHYLPPPLHVPEGYQDPDAAVKVPPVNGVMDGYPPNISHRDGIAHSRRGAGRRGSFAGRKPPCLFFPAGRCKNGDDCRFPHVIPDTPGAHHPSHFSARAGHGGPRPRGNPNGQITSVEEKLNNLNIRDDTAGQQNGTTNSSRSHSSEAGHRPRFQHGVKGHHANANNSVHGRKSIPVKQRVPNADEFPVLSGSITPPIRNSGSNNSAGPGLTAAQVLQAPPPARKEGTREVSSPVQKVCLFRNHHKSGRKWHEPETPSVSQEQPAKKLPISFAAVATAAPDVAKEVSVSA
ncbi:hypothetical protein BDQ17DRAFT_1341310 [Cyathus striatus]|nr:hypothetical protein BDQ17DRAFT_1341310 [Cyathus striatus]